MDAFFAPAERVETDDLLHLGADVIALARATRAGAVISRTRPSACAALRWRRPASHR